MEVCNFPGGVGMTNPKDPTSLKATDIKLFRENTWGLQLTRISFHIANVYNQEQPEPKAGLMISPSSTETSSKPPTLVS